MIMRFVLPLIFWRFEPWSCICVRNYPQNWDQTTPALNESLPHSGNLQVFERTNIYRRKDFGPKALNPRGYLVDHSSQVRDGKKDPQFFGIETRQGTQGLGVRGVRLSISLYCMLPENRTTVATMFVRRTRKHNIKKCYSLLLVAASVVILLVYNASAFLVATASTKANFFGIETR